MAIDHGYDGSVAIGAATVAYITEWTIEMAGDALEITNFGSTYDREYTPGMRSYTGTLSGYSEDTDAAQRAVLAEFTTAALPAKVTLRCLTNNNAGNIAGFTGSAILTGVTRGATPDGLQTFSANCQYTCLLYTSPSPRDRS